MRKTLALALLAAAALLGFAHALPTDGLQQHRDDKVNTITEVLGS